MASHLPHHRRNHTRRSWDKVYSSHRHHMWCPFCWDQGYYDKQLCWFDCCRFLLCNSCFSKYWILVFSTAKDKYHFYPQVLQELEPVITFWIGIVRSLCLIPDYANPDADPVNIPCIVPDCSGHGVCDNGTYLLPSLLWIILWRNDHVV